jgi:two-component system, chemotaxis family, CheB/CheR fusion protein
MMAGKRETLQELKARLSEAEDVLRAIREGDVDAVVVKGARGRRVYTLESAESPYRLFLEQMQEGAATIASDGRILFANRSFADILGLALSGVVGQRVENLFNEEALEKLIKSLKGSRKRHATIELRQRAASGVEKPLRLSIRRVIGGEEAFANLVMVDLSEREALADAVRSERHLRDILNSLHTLAAVMTPDGVVVDVNETALRLGGVHREDIIGKHAEDTVFWSYSEESREIARSAITYAGRGQIVRREARICGKDGNIDVDLVVAAMRDTQGKVTHLIASGIDITERKRAEEARRESEERLRSLAENVPCVLMRFDRQLRVVYLNQQSDRYNPNPVERMIGRTNREMGMPKHLCDLWDAAVERVFRTAAQEELEFDLAGPSGLCTFALKLGPEFGPDQEVQYVLGVSSDITERVRAEEAVAAAHRQLQSIIDNTPAIVYAFDLQEHFLLANISVAQIFNTTPGKMIGKRRHEFMPKEDADWHEANDRRVVEAGSALEFEEYSQLEDRSITWLTTKFPLRDAEGRIFAVAGISADISEHKRAEDELRAARTRAEEARTAAEKATAIKDEFLAVLSHELRTPLSAVLGAVQLLERNQELPEKARDYLEVVRRNLDLEARLIDDLLDLTRIMRGKLSLEKKAVNINNILKHVVESCRADIEAKGLAFKLDLARTPQFVSGDSSRLQQVFWNILKNSIKFTTGGGCISVRECSQDGKVMVEVNDSGIGIDPAFIPRLFTAFEQGDRSVTRQFGGLGLGLAITKRLIEMHDGAITAESAGRGEGATFRVILPTKKETETETETETEKVAAVHVPLSRRILLVEDHNDTGAMMQMLLESAGYQVVTAFNVQQALETIENGNFDLVISDLGLPDRSGFELMKELRRREETLKGIALSGYGREEDVRRSKEAGFVEHITKPVDFDALVALVERVIQ